MFLYIIKKNTCFIHEIQAKPNVFSFKRLTKNQNNKKRSANL